MLLITGATGTVGRELVQQLLDRGEQVRVFVRDPRKVADLGERVECAVGDLNRLETVQDAMRGVRGVFLVTSATQQDRNAIAAARQNGVRHLVKLSTIEAGHAHIVGHGKWHHEREELIRASGLLWTFLRPTMFASTALEWAATIKSEGTVYYPGGDGKIAPIDPYDIAAVAAVALTHPGQGNQAYALTGPELLSIRQMVTVLANALGTPLRYVDVPDAVAGEQMVKAGVPAYAAQGLVEVLEAVRAGECEDQTDDVERITGRPPQTFEMWCHAHTRAFTSETAIPE